MNQEHWSSIALKLHKWSITHPRHTKEQTAQCISVLDPQSHELQCASLHPLSAFLCHPVLHYTYTDIALHCTKTVHLYHVECGVRQADGWLVYCLWCLFVTDMGQDTKMNIYQSLLGQVKISHLGNWVHIGQNKLTEIYAANIKLLDSVVSLALILYTCNLFILFLLYIDFMFLSNCIL